MVGEPTEDDTGDTWQEVTAEFSRLGSSIREHYAEHDDAGVVDELRDAFADLVGAASRVGSAIAAAFGDPDVRHQAKRTVSALLAAVAGTADDVRNDLQDRAESGADEAE